MYEEFTKELSREELIDLVATEIEKVKAQAAFCKEHNIPDFTFRVCPTCRNNWTMRYTVERAGNSHITSCPFCHMSWCD